MKVKNFTGENIYFIAIKMCIHSRRSKDYNIFKKSALRKNRLQLFHCRTEPLNVLTL